MGQLGIGIVGTGVIAGTHASAIAGHSGARVVSVYDIDADRAARARDEWGADEAASSLEQLLGNPDVDAVIVCTPAAFHAEPTIAALSAGKHVLCEKPLALNVAQAEAMVRAAEESGRFLSCASARMRLGPRYRLARRMIESGELGEVYHVRHSSWRVRIRPGQHYMPHAQWFLDKSLAGGGVIMDIGVYAVDAALWMLGNPEVLSVSAQTRQISEVPGPPGVEQDVEDHGVVFVQCAGGRSIVIETAWISTMSPPEDMTIVGTEASLRLDPFTKVSPRQVAAGEYDPILEWQRSMNPGGDDPAVFRPIEERMDPGGASAVFPDDVTREFIDGVLAGVQPHTSGREALTVTRIIDAAYRSVAEGCGVAL